MLLYTDGVTDTPGTEERFGPERLAAILADAPEAPVRVLGRIEAALREFQAGTAIDDRAMLVLRFAGETGPDSRPQSRLNYDLRAMTSAPPRPQPGPAGP